MAEEDQPVGNLHTTILPDLSGVDLGSPLVDVVLRVELPFWVMVDNSELEIEYSGHRFRVTCNDNTWELHGGFVSDAKYGVLYQGRHRNNDDLSASIRQLLEDDPDLSMVWRKTKTVIRMNAKCHVSAWQAEDDYFPALLYREELCRAYIPVLNRFIQVYRLATYDYFAFEVSPWDVPLWHIENDGVSATVRLVPYRGWDTKPAMFERRDEAPTQYQLIDSAGLAAEVGRVAFPGEFELLDALNLMERGDYSGAVRRVTTAVEVAVEHAAKRIIEASEGAQAARDFVKQTWNDFVKRLNVLEAKSGRTVPRVLRSEFHKTRNLRMRIVHEAHRISSNDRGAAQKAVDTGRWFFNWVEDDDARRAVRESRIAYRSLGRDTTYGAFRTEVTAQGIVVAAWKEPGTPV